MTEAKIRKGRATIKSAEDELEALQKAYHSTFSSVTGRKVLDDLEIRNWLRSPTISSQLHYMAYREGQRSVLLYIKTMMEWDIKELREMIKEMEKGQDMEPEL